MEDKDKGFLIMTKPHLIKLKIKSENLPILVESKEELIKELKKKSYTEEQIERFVSQSKFA